MESTLLKKFQAPKKQQMPDFSLALYHSSVGKERKGAGVGKGTTCNSKYDSQITLS